MCASSVSENELCQQLNLNLMETEIMDGNPPHRLWFVNSTTVLCVCVCFVVDAAVIYCCFFCLSLMCETVYIIIATVFSQFVFCT